MKNLALLFYALILISTSSTTYAQDTEGMHYGANETFTYWAGEEPWEGIEVLNGEYWESSHFTKEYIMYMEVIVPKEMALEFINDPYNKLELTEGKVSFPSDAPDWFKPMKDCKVYKSGQQGSLYFINIETGHLFLYEIQV